MSFTDLLITLRLNRQTTKETAKLMKSTLTNMDYKFSVKYMYPCKGSIVHCPKKQDNFESDGKVD